MKKICVIGAGASGIIAAIFAAKNSNSVILFEKQKKTGRKILASGNGRCNITNRFLDASRYHGTDPSFAGAVLNKFGLRHTIRFFESIGLPLIEEENGRFFPASLQAASVTQILEYELNKNKIDLQLHHKVDKILRKDNKFKIITAGHDDYIFDSVILASGSCASALGGSRDGYILAKSLGHKIIEPFPAILPLNIPLKPLHSLEGIKWDCALSVSHNGKTVGEATGELLFTKYGISGPAALNISRHVNQNVISNKQIRITIDFFPKFSQTQLKDYLENLWTDKDKTISFSLTGILKSRMPQTLLKIGGIDTEKKIKDLSERDKEKITYILKSFSIEPGSAREFNEAVVAAGGVCVDEINPETMESKIVKNLYITGELLDIDGDSGGYNLQFAWSTGAIAGMSQ